MQLKDKVIVITGGSSGLGKTLVALLVKEGAAVVISSNMLRELDKAASELGAVGVAVDVTSEAEVRRLAQEVVKQFDRIDIWINNAGVWMPHVAVEAMDMAKLHAVFEVNVFGTIYGSRAALAQMRKQGGGTIVNVISVSALEGRPYSSGYCASKFAADGFTKSLRLEAAQNNIAVLAVYPGRMKTHLFDEGKPADYDRFMAPETVAARIVDNLAGEKPEVEMVIDE